MEFVNDWEKQLEKDKIKERKTIILTLFTNTLIPNFLCNKANATK